MKIELEHNFKHNCHDVKSLLTDVNKLSTFISRLDKLSKLYPDRYDPDTFKGDGFELFVEFLIKASPVDNRIGISEYNIVNGNDTGVDGVGIGTNGEIATVQAKYRNDQRWTLTANTDHLSNFTSTSLMRYNVNPDSTKNMLIITTAEGLHHYTANVMFQNQVRCLGYKELRVMVDNNLVFWNLFRKSLDL